MISNKKFLLFNGMYYFFLVMLVFLMVLSLIFECEELFCIENIVMFIWYWYLFFICATFGFVVNYVCFGVVKYVGLFMVKMML